MPFNTYREHTESASLMQAIGAQTPARNPFGLRSAYGRYGARKRRNGTRVQYDRPVSPHNAFSGSGEVPAARPDERRNLSQAVAQHSMATPHEGRRVRRSVGSAAPTRARSYLAWRIVNVRIVGERRPREPVDLSLEGLIVVPR